MPVIAIIGAGPGLGIEIARAFGAIARNETRTEPELRYVALDE